jgi:hypothetical protein
MTKLDWTRVNIPSRSYAPPPVKLTPAQKKRRQAKIKAVRAKMTPYQNLYSKLRWAYPEITDEQLHEVVVQQLKEANTKAKHSDIESIAKNTQLDSDRAVYNAQPRKRSERKLKHR